MMNLSSDITKKHGSFMGPCLFGFMEDAKSVGIDVEMLKKRFLSGRL